MTRTKNLTWLFLCVMLTAACGGPHNAGDFSNANPQLVAEPDKVSALLADAADRASNALETLAAVEYSRTPGVAVAPIGNAPPELKRAITVNWVGPVEQITKTMADRASYNFLAIGSPPPVPIVVSIDVENKPVIDVLRDIGLQLGLRADLKVNANGRVVELHYPPTSGLGG
ncbi:DotD/TraH family lipoprotein [Alphaproteobacteria bacterium]|nr:DotD/TraH family lipoprotein [Alphaproteobacteria bacterium]